MCSCDKKNGGRLVVITILACLTWGVYLCFTCNGFLLQILFLYPFCVTTWADNHVHICVCVCMCTHHFLLMLWSHWWFGRLIEDFMLPDLLIQDKGCVRCTRISIFYHFWQLFKSNLMDCSAEKCTSWHCFYPWQDA